MSLSRRTRRRIVFGLLLVIGGGLALTRLIDGHYPWLWAYVARQIAPAREASTPPVHVLFTFVDHFEPHDQATMDRWMSAYPALARRHHDADGTMPQHSWFWFFAKSKGKESFQFLQQLARLTYDGFGEVELHLHHENDTEPTFLEHITYMIRLSQRTGAMVTAEPHPRTTFGFIHGMWALDNSRDATTGEACGINNELILLRQLGCYADFTHPSWGRMHPRTIDQLYYVTDDPRRPKSYDTGTRMRVGGSAVGDLLLIEGPSVVHRRGLRPVYDHGDVTMVDLPTPQRIDAWVRAGVHVQGRPEWVFVKIFTHGAILTDHDAVLGSWADQMHTYLETRYNDGQRYVLHYVTAREAYNIAKAAEAGKTGNPHLYRDFVIPPYANHVITASVPFDFLTMQERTIAVRLLAPPGTRVAVQVHAPNVEVSGDATVVSVKPAQDSTKILLITHDEGIIEFTRKGM